MWCMVPYVLLDLVELWCACAGPGVTIPRAGELVVYFPQGHLEQVLWLLFYFIAWFDYSWRSRRRNYELVWSICCLLDQARRVVPKHLGGVCFATSQSTCPSGSSNLGPRRPKPNVWEQRSCQADLHGCKANSPLEGVPPQIICRVLNVQLKVVCLMLLRLMCWDAILFSISCANKIPICIVPLCSLKRVMSMLGCSWNLSL
jgi:hypothetical protein